MTAYKEKRKTADISDEERQQIVGTVKFLLSILESYLLSKRLATRQILLLEARLRIRELYNTALRYNERIKENLDSLLFLFDTFQGEGEDIEKGILYCNTILEYLEILNLQRNC